MNRNEAAALLADTTAQAIDHSLAGALDRLQNDLVHGLKQANIKWVRIPGPGGEKIGVKSGQLYYLIKEIKTASDTQAEEQLKIELLNRLLGEGIVEIREYQGTRYHCAPLQDWERVLAKKLLVRE